MKHNIGIILILSLFFINPLLSQCNLVIEYDEAGNRVFRGTPCDPDCSLQVTSTEDSGNGSLRKAIFCADDGDVIWFSGSLENAIITLTSRSIEIDKDIQISTYEPPPLTQTGQTAPEVVDLKSTGAHRLFDIVEEADVTIYGLNLLSSEIYSDSPSILINEGTLTLQDMYLTQFGEITAQSSAIYNTGTLNILGTVILKHEN